MHKFQTLDQLAASGKTVLLRADLNVPMQDGIVTDATRLTRLLPTVRELAKAGAKVVILSHFGRPRGVDPKLSLQPLAAELAKALDQPVGFANDCIGPEAQTAVNNLPPGGIVLLENLRFHAEEEKNDKAFAHKLAELGNVYVNDAFSCAHRAHASTEAIAHLLPAYAGRLMEAELKALEQALENPQRPVVAIVGGAKISTKLDLLNNLVRKIDTLVLGGGMANTFLSAQGTPMGKSLCERDMREQALAIMAAAANSKCRVLLPVDGVMAAEFRANAPYEVTSTESVPEGMMMLDIGPQSVAEIMDTVKKAKTVLWNGPVGAFETAPFDGGTTALAKEIGALTKAGKLVTVAGGGDTVAALAKAGVEDDMTYVSTAGGAFLEWLEGKTLPGVAALEQKAAA